MSVNLGRSMAATERFAARVNKTETCWLWTGTITSLGYGQFMVDGRTVSTHRWSYEHHVGPIPSGLVIDHLCRVRNCVNPEHLEPVTNAENVLRGAGLAPTNAAKTHCDHGHPFDAANTYIPPAGFRQCRECNRAATRRRRARRQEVSA